MESLITFETAKLAREKGFNFPKVYPYREEFVYDKSELIKIVIGNYQSMALKIVDGITYNAPTQSVLQKWIRENHKIHIEIHPDNYDEVDNEWRFCLLKLRPDIKFVETTEFMIYRTYEKAMEEALKMALNYIEVK